MAGYYDPNKDYSLAIKQAKDSGASASEISRLQSERQNKIDAKYGGSDPYKGSSNIMGSGSISSKTSGSFSKKDPSGGSYDRDVADAVKNTWDSVYSGGSAPAGVDYHQQAIDAAARGDWGSVASALNQRQQKINTQGGNDRGMSNSQILQQLREQYGSSFDALSARDQDTVRLYAGESLQYPNGTDAVSLGKGWENGVDYLAMARQLAAQGDLMGAYDALQRRGYKMFDTGSAGGGTTQAQAYADIQKAWMNSSGAQQTWQNEKSANQQRLSALGLLDAAVNPSNAGKTLLKRTADGKTTYWVSYDANGAPVIASPVSQDVTKMGKSPGYSPEEIAAMAQYYGADAYDPNMYMYLHNMAVDRTGVGRKYDSTGTLLLNETDFAPAGLQMDGSGLAGSMNTALGGSGNILNPYSYLNQQATIPNTQGGTGVQGSQLPQAGNWSYGGGYGADISDASQYLRDMYAQQIAAELAALKSTYEQNLADISSQDDLISSIYAQQRNQAAAQNDLQRMQMNEYGIMRGLSSGASGQMALAQSAALQGNLAQFGTQEAQSLSDNALNRQKLTIAYRNAADQAAAEGNAQLASALYDEYVRQQELALQQQAAAQEQANWEAKFQYQRQQDSFANAASMAELLAGFGDFSGYKALGYSDAQIAMMQNAYNAQLAGSTFNAGSAGNGTGGTPKKASGGSYDNGNLTAAQVKQLQQFVGASADGLWGKKSSEQVGGATANQAWKAYQAAMSATDYKTASAALKSAGTSSANLLTATEFVRHKNSGNSDYAAYRTYQEYLQDAVFSALV